MEKYKEISRRIMVNQDEGGMACGPVTGVTACDAEIVIDDNGKTVYLHAQWVDECDDEILLEATYTSVYDVYDKLNKCDWKDRKTVDALLTERDRIVADGIEDDTKYQDIYDELKKMVDDKLHECGLIYEE